VAEYGQSLRRLKTAGAAADRTPRPESRAIFARADAENRSALFENEARDLLRLYGFDLPPGAVIRTEAEVPDLPESLTRVPLAMKIISQDILHKSEAGCVKLNVTGADGRRDAFRQVLQNAKNYKAQARIEGVLATPMLKPGVEVILGVIHDDTFGHVLMFGLGGVLVEVLGDVSFRTLPLARIDAREMIEDIDAVEILNGVRGAPAIDREALIDVIVKLSDMVWRHPEISELDLNPVIARPDGVSIADARIILGP
jgi:acetyltransferase